MADYAIGDVHGQYTALQRLLDAIGYADGDTLWFVGDLINRGPDSLGVLRFVHSLGDKAKLVLGNHDFALLVQAQGFKNIKVKKTVQSIIDADDSEVLLHFLRHTPMMQCHDALGVVVVHAGWYPQWDAAQAQAANALICRELTSTQYRTFLYESYGDEPRCYTQALAHGERDMARFAVNAFCRMRYLDKRQCLEFSSKMPPKEAPAKLKPWFTEPTASPYKIVFGHWASLGLQVNERYACIDAGAAWGGSLVAFDLAAWQVAARVNV